MRADERGREWPFAREKLLSVCPTGCSKRLFGEYKLEQI